MIFFNFTFGFGKYDRELHHSLLKTSFNRYISQRCTGNKGYKLHANISDMWVFIIQTLKKICIEKKLFKKLPIFCAYSLSEIRLKMQISKRVFFRKKQKKVVVKLLNEDFLFAQRIKFWDFLPSIAITDRFHDF